MRYNSPLRYPGGKGRLTDFFSQLIENNDLHDGTYIEPFAGGAGVAISLLLRDQVRRIAINDVDRPIYAFWRAVVDHPEEFVQLIHDTPVTVKQWKLQKAVQRDHSANVLEQGFSTFYLNRTNRSGVLDGGPIGGLEQQGPYKIGARYNKAKLAERIERIGKLSGRIDVYGIDAQDFIKDTLPRYDPDNTLVYLDPPYYRQGAYLYMNYYHHQDHLHLSEALDGSIYSWVVSYDDVPVIRDFYRPYRHQEFCLDYSAYEYRKGHEIMFFSGALRLPETILLPGQI